MDSTGMQLCHFDDLKFYIYATKGIVFFHFLTRNIVKQLWKILWDTWLRLWLFFVFDTCLRKLPLVDWVKYLAKVCKCDSWEVLVSYSFQYSSQSQNVWQGDPARNSCPCFSELADQEVVFLAIILCFTFCRQYWWIDTPTLLNIFCLAYLNSLFCNLISVSDLCFVASLSFGLFSRFTVKS